MEIVMWITLGILTGYSVSFLSQTKQSVWIDILLGVVGSVIGGVIMTLFRKPGVAGFSMYSIFVAVLGSIVLVWTGRQGVRENGIMEK